MSGYIRIRTPDDKPGDWTAEGDVVPGIPYTYVSGDVAVVLDWFEAATLDVERLAQALNASVGSVGWLHLTPADPVEEWRENARVIAREYAALLTDAVSSGQHG